MDLHKSTLSYQIETCFAWLSVMQTSPLARLLRARVARPRIPAIVAPKLLINTALLALAEAVELVFRFVIVKNSRLYLRSVVL